ncbi:shikimate kinase [Scopulibacillus darangshiensis]|uniref:Shikimate kinase n=1 Tax=Scopulibacillus darangshiensis TaxID=442528 RepID=A0A4R2P8J4_9BACL|nr:shikimate kinase [Scopulibacillus darangshiensis]TCP31157.1 shikimate kinase [Scopulibacillus darangshiensis]
MEGIVVNEAVFLTGFMGAGKTTVGGQLAKVLGLDVFDTDHVIEKTFKKSISDIFADQGEAYFRECEQRVLRELSSKRAVITTGGGVILDEGNRQIMKKNGITIYLHCSPSKILKRLAGDTTRPLLHGDQEQKVITMLEKRLPYYLEADYTVNTTMKSVQTIISEIVNLLYRHRNLGS